jgi:hypothetical protein
MQLKHRRTFFFLPSLLHQQRFSNKYMNATYMQSSRNLLAQKVQLENKSHEKIRYFRSIYPLLCLDESRAILANANEHVQLPAKPKCLKN